MRKYRRIISGLVLMIVLSLAVTEYLPQFRLDVYAYTGSEWGGNYVLINHTEGEYSRLYYSKKDEALTGGSIDFLLPRIDDYGYFKLLLPMMFGVGWTGEDDGTTTILDYGYFSEISIPLDFTVEGWKEAPKTSDYTFEDTVLKNNFSQKTASDLFYIQVKDGQRIPVCALGLVKGEYPDKPRVTEADVQETDSVMQELYRKVEEIEAQTTPAVGGYYPEQAELLKQISIETFCAIYMYDIMGIDYVQATEYDSTRRMDYNEYIAHGMKMAQDLEDKAIFTGFTQVLRKYLEYVESHKIAAPSITSFQLGDAKIKIDNDQHTITINGNADDFANKKLEDAKITLPEGLKGAWEEGASSFADPDLTYQVYPYNENLATKDHEKYKDLGVEYQIQFGTIEEEKPVIQVSPEGLTGAKADVTVDKSNPSKTYYNVTAAGRLEEITDGAGQHYAFACWELDEQNRDLDSANLYTGNIVKKLHGNTDIIQRFLMPSNPLTLTAVYKPAHRITAVYEGLDEGQSFSLSGSDLALMGWMPEGYDIELYYGNYQIPEGMQVREILISDSQGNPVNYTRTEENGTVRLKFSMPSDDVTAKVIFEKDPDTERTLSLRTADGPLVAGKAGSVSLPLTAEGYSETAVFTAAESYSTGLEKDPDTEGLSFTVETDAEGKKAVKVTTTAQVKEGTYYCVVKPSEGKKTAVGTVEVMAADARYLKASDGSVTLKEGEAGQTAISGISLNLSSGTSVEAVETTADGTVKISDKTEGLSFEKATLNDDKFTMTVHVSKTVAAGDYYFVVKGGGQTSPVAKLTVNRTPGEEPEEPAYAIHATCNPNQGSIEIKVNGQEASEAREGDTVTVTAVPKSGYKLTKWSINQDMDSVPPSSGTLTDTTVSFVMPGGIVTVGAAFETSESGDTTEGPAITAFVIDGVQGVVDQTAGTVTVNMPAGTDVKALKPSVAVKDTVSMTPENGTAVDFTNSVVYTLTGADGTVRQYAVSVYVEEKDAADSLWDQIVSPTGPRSWWKQAESIKGSSKDRYPRFW